MIGAELSKKVHGKVTEKENLKITTMKGCYHDVRLPKPNVVIGKWDTYKKSTNKNNYYYGLN